MYTVYWKNMYSEWVDLDKKFIFYWRAKGYVSKRIVDRLYVKEWKIEDSNKKVLLYIKREI